MSKLLNRCLKYTVIKAKYGKAAGERYLKSCAYYDGAALLGIKGINAWMLKNCNFNQPATRKPHNKTKVLGIVVLGLLFPLSLVVTVPLYIFSRRQK